MLPTWKLRVNVIYITNVNCVTFWYTVMPVFTCVQQVLVSSNHFASVCLNLIYLCIDLLGANNSSLGFAPHPHIPWAKC